MRVQPPRAAALVPEISGGRGRDIQNSIARIRLRASQHIRFTGVRYRTRADRADSAPPPALVQNVRINHRRSHAAVPEQFLDRSDVVPSLEQVGGKRVPQRMARSRALQHGFVQVVPPPFTCRLIDVKPGRGKDPLPGPLTRRVGVLCPERGSSRFCGGHAVSHSGQSGASASTRVVLRCDVAFSRTRLQTTRGDTHVDVVHLAIAFR